MASIQQLALPAQIRASVQLPGSKSESNRALMLHYLSERKVTFTNLSTCEDVKILHKILDKNPRRVDVKDSGTALRFLMAYFCITNKNRIISGSERLHERPVGKLAEALRQLGFRINYLRRENYPPVEIVPVDHRLLRQKTFVDAGESSQYVSALLLIAPLMPMGMEIELSQYKVSQPYFRLTLDMLRRAGIVFSEFGAFIKITKQNFRPVELSIGGDWSSAATWYAMAALSEKAEITLKGLSIDSLQGDKIIAEWMSRFGVISDFYSDRVTISKQKSVVSEPVKLDFTDHPDLAQVMMTVAAALNVRLHCTGIRNLQIKETNRIEAMQKELIKLNARLDLINENECVLYPEFRLLDNRFKTYNDHRMILAFAPLAVREKIIIENPLAVRKSYPQFWEHVEAIESL